MPEEPKQQHESMNVQIAVLGERMEMLRKDMDEIKTILIQRDDKYALKADVDELRKNFNKIALTIIGVFIASVATVVWKG